MRFNKLLLALLPCALWAQIGGSFLSGDLVRGGSALTTPGRVPTVSALGTLGQSDVSLASGIFSRAGTVGLSATGANVVTFSTNGVERGRWTSAGNLLTGTATDDTSFKLQAVSTYSGGLGYGATARFASSGGASVLAIGNANGASNTKWNYIGAGDHVIFFGKLTDAYGPTEWARFSAAGNLLVGTTTDDGSSKLQVAGAVAVTSTLTIANNQGIRGSRTDSGTAFIGIIDSANRAGYGYNSVGVDIFSGTTAKLSLTNGVLTLYDPTATTGVTSAVIRAGAGQSTTALTTWQNNAGSELASISAGNGANFVQGLRVQGANVPAASDGLELQYSGGEGSILAYNRTAPSWQPMRVRGSAVSLEYQSTVKIKVNGDGIGFFGVTPVARQTATADAASILALLQAYGLSN